MPDLPTVTVTPDQYDLVVELFSDQFGGVGQPETFEEVYTLFTRRIMRGNIQNNKANIIVQQYDSDKEAAVAQAWSDLTTVWPQE